MRMHMRMHMHMHMLMIKVYWPKGPTSCSTPHTAQHSTGGTLPAYHQPNSTSAPGDK